MTRPALTDLERAAQKLQAMERGRQARKLTERRKMRQQIRREVKQVVHIPLYVALELVLSGQFACMPTWGSNPRQARRAFQGRRYHSSAGGRTKQQHICSGMSGTDDNWAVEDDKEYMRYSIINFQTNVSIVGGLLLTILLPPLIPPDAFQTSYVVSTAPGFETCTEENCPSTVKYLPSVIMCCFVAASITDLGTTIISIQSAPHAHSPFRPRACER